MKPIFGWIFSIVGLIFMIGFGFSSLMAILGLFSHTIDYTWPIVYIAATIGFWWIWKQGGKLRHH